MMYDIVYLCIFFWIKSPENSKTKHFCYKMLWGEKVYGDSDIFSGKKYAQALLEFVLVAN